MSTPKGGHSGARIDAATAQVSPLERGGEALDLPADRAPGVSVAQVARRHALNANLIFKWLKDPRFAPAGAVEEEPVFLSAEVREDDAPTVPMASPAGDPPHGRVQIVLATGHRMTVEGPFDGDALGRLLSILARP